MTKKELILRLNTLGMRLGHVISNSKNMTNLEFEKWFNNDIDNVFQDILDDLDKEKNNEY